MRWLLIAASMLLLGCSKHQSARETPPAARDTLTNRAVTNSPSLVQNLRAAPSPLEPEKLVALLPAPTAFPELSEAPPPSSGRRVLGSGELIHSASREFRFRNGGFLWVSLSDYAQAPSELQREASLVEDPAKDYPSQLLEFVSLPGGKGYVLWDPISRNGRFRALIAHRFLLYGEGGDLPAKIAWSRLLDLFPLEQLRRASEVVPQARQ